jgi:phenylalanine-4-hydroxylase
MHVSDAARDITILALDHPGAQDPLYRARRDEIAEAARQNPAPGQPPALDYADGEHETWRLVCERLAERHERLASQVYLEGRHKLSLSTTRIPDLRELSASLQRWQGFRLAAIEGLVPSQRFLSQLGSRVMSCTQYLRHGSRPEYTPEPDVVHEVIGHVPLFVDPDFAALSERIGRAAARADARQAAMLDKLYWFTLEFGLVEEAHGLRAYGAGLLSSFGEIEHAFTEAVTRRPFDLEEVIDSVYDHTRMQDLLFVIPSFRALDRELDLFLASPRYLGA